MDCLRDGTDEFSKKLQRGGGHFQWGGGGGQRPFGTFPKIHPFWKRHPSLRQHIYIAHISHSRHFQRWCTFSRWCTFTTENAKYKVCTFICWQDGVLPKNGVKIQWCFTLSSLSFLSQNDISLIENHLILVLCCQGQNIWPLDQQWE